jgi:hypothetical protein
MASHIVKKGSIYRTNVVLKTKANFISIECGMGCHTSNTTIPYGTPSPLHFITSFKSEKNAHLFVTILPRILQYILKLINHHMESRFT